MRTTHVTIFVNDLDKEVYLLETLHVHVHVHVLK